MLRGKGEEVRAFSIGTACWRAQRRTHFILGHSEEKAGTSRGDVARVCHEIFGHGSAYPEPLINPVVTIYPRSGQNLRG